MPLSADFGPRYASHINIWLAELLLELPSSDKYLIPKHCTHVSNTKHGLTHAQASNIFLGIQTNIAHKSWNSQRDPNTIYWAFPDTSQIGGQTQKSQFVLMGFTQPPHKSLGSQTSNPISSGSHRRPLTKQLSLHR